MSQYKLHPIIQELVDREIPVEITKEGFKVSGFYKSDTVTLEYISFPAFPGNNHFKCHQRYNRVDEIDCFADLVGVNYYWWLESKDSWEDWKIPDPHWQEALLEFDYVKKTVKTVEEWN